MRVIGTAGHVDHGKSTLVQRLTGIDPDRLAEEKKRALTIDLGFAWLHLPSGEILGVVDVPGHRDFVANMLAGVGGIDAVLFVVAADEGVMPQTREHLAILDLLDVKNGLVVLTKTDLIDDPDWLTLIEMDVQEMLVGTCLENAAMIPVSANTGAGIPELLSALNHLLDDIPVPQDINQPRLPVDRVFTMSGFGTVVTGTLLGGRLKIGDEIEFQPSGVRGRIRGLQSYQKQVDIAYPGSRVAVNIVGVNRDEVTRGETLTIPGQITPTSLLDARLRHLPDAGKPLRHNAEVKVFVGTAESVARIRLLDHDEIHPGETGWVQIRLEKPLALTHGDRFILRYPSPPLTIGGGLIVDPHPEKRWKRFRSSVIERLQMLLNGTPGQRVAQSAEGNEPVKRSVLQQMSGYSAAIFEDALAESLDEGLLVELQPGRYLAASSFHHLLRETRRTVMRFHDSFPLRAGIPREELRSRLGVKGATLNGLLSHLEQEITSEGTLVRHSMHQVMFNAKQQEHIDQLMRIISQNPYSPPSVAESLQIVGEAVLRALVEMGRMVQVQSDVIFTLEAYDEMVAVVLKIIEQNGSVDAKTLRDQFQTTRKYAIALLEHLDSTGVTRREGDVRVRGRA